MMLWTIVGMALVTAVPRVVPVFIMEKLNLPGWGRKWLAAIPYAALGALIIPGIFTVIEGQPWIGMAGGGAALTVAWLRAPIMVVVLVAIAIVFILNGFQSL
ncbi:AzlD domain-containing protein [Salimicrobium halophilum]|uniref:Branched-chain amino acid transport protein n=1 Tax=Salimicrobium halophilum TaxID=86666 RepID=A0A1G8TLM3_9BACI|nr:AzlD domain-containing protein [Salimicrobium halophilum]SDJ42353.1 Branched-chain amino acid transport protein [Salimicrobium halophilum]